MISELRTLFNANFTKEKYASFLKQLGQGYAPIPFRVAETPVFLPADLVKKLVAAGEELIKLIQQPNFKDLTQRAIPRQWAVPGENEHPHFLTFDFGICSDKTGELTPMLIEMQGFPSLYGFQQLLAATYTAAFALPKNLSPYFCGLEEDTYIALLKKVIVGAHEPEEVALMDLEAPDQKTAIDFYITQRHLGIAVLSVSDIQKEGRRLYYIKDNKKVWLKRIYNRLIFDEVDNSAELFAQNFDPREELDIEWVTHPNWFYRISKYTMPYLHSAFVPETFFLDTLTTIPADLENYVLKPLFSFAGQGVVIDVQASDIHQIKDPENWILQRKVHYTPAVLTPDGNAKVEIRLMYLWPDGEAPQLCINIARLSKGKMIGVNYNKTFDWVGGTVGLMENPPPDAL